MLEEFFFVSKQMRVGRGEGAKGQTDKRANGQTEAQQEPRQKLKRSCFGQERGFDLALRLQISTVYIFFFFFFALLFQLSIYNS